MAAVYSPEPLENLPWLTRLIQSEILGKSPVGAYLRLNRFLWNRLPASVIASRPIRLYGDFLHTLVRRHSRRGQLHSTFFLRNRPALELIRQLVKRSSYNRGIRIAVLGCSTGAEAYSIAWAIRSARPDLVLILNAVDISEKAVEIARAGIYRIGDSKFTGADMFDGLTEAEIGELFERAGNVARVNSSIKEGIRWRVGDATDPSIVEVLGPQDIIVANNFLCHMEPIVAMKCLHNIAGLLSRGGYIFVSGVDLDVKTTVAQQRGWLPIEEHLEEVHNGDPRMTREWPFNYSSLEPLNKRRRDWKIRYSQVFQVGY